MESMSVEIKNCYGIRDLYATFDFSKCPASIIYAPNGMMKTSFAKTFKDYSGQVESRDQIYKDREPVRVLKDQAGNEISSESVFVIEPYVQDYQSARISTLLVVKELKDEYDTILTEINQKKDVLLKSLKSASGLKKDLEEVLSSVFTEQEDRFLAALERVRTEVMEESPSSLSAISYSSIFIPKVEEFLQSSETRDSLIEYTQTYDDLLSKSKYFKKGVFNHYQAGEIAKQLKANGFFKAEHSIYLTSGDQKREITTEAELEETITSEMTSILADPKLKSAFEKIDNKLKANTELRAFREFLLNNQEVVAELANPALLKQKLWKAYLVSNRDAYISLMTVYDGGKRRLDEITSKATAEATKWQDVINIFNRRFSVPFKVGIENKQDVILRRVTPNITFQFFDDDQDAMPVDRSDLVSVLSNGEKRALYILNIIFEVEARKEAGIPTLFVIDDIADSFDYKNKYAIVEYLSDILQEPNFRQIILTHNYDFYRTVWSRLSLGGSNFHVVKSGTKISIEPERMFRHPFEKWKKSAENPNKGSMLIALIPFVRNIADYCGYEQDFALLTSLLHMKPGTTAVTKRELIAIFSRLLNGQEFAALENLDESVAELIFREAGRIVEAAPIDSELETKIALSIAIRLRAEEYLISKIADPEFVASITKNQTAKLIKRFASQYSGDPEAQLAIKIMERVNLMTPENIHLNSFMYEPILDMSSEHLADLYREACELSE